MTGWSSFSTGYFDVTAPALSPYPKKYLPVCSLRIIRIKEIPFHSLNSSRENDRKNFNELDITIAFRFDNTAGNILSPKDSRGRTPTAKGRGGYEGNILRSNRFRIFLEIFLLFEGCIRTRNVTFFVRLFSMRTYFVTINYGYSVILYLIVYSTRNRIGAMKGLAKSNPALKFTRDCSRVKN